MEYKIFFVEKAQKEFEKLTLSHQKKITKHIDELGINPTPRTKNFRRLTAYDLYRLRVGDLRIIYSIDYQNKIVIIEKIKKRDEKLYKLL